MRSLQMTTFKRFGGQQLPRPGAFVNTRILRDLSHRYKYADNEVERRALKYIATNTTLPQKARVRAALKLANMPKSSAPTTIKDRCIFTGRARALIRPFGLCRIAFRQMAYAGLLPGVRKASW